MAGSLSAISALFAASASLGCVYLAVATYAVYVFPRRRRPNAEPAVPVSVLKPLHGAEPGLYARLSANFDQTYQGEIQLVCGIREQLDAAVHVVRNAQQTTDKPIELIVSCRDHGPNRKVSNLVNMLPSATNEILIVSDSDIEVGRDYLSKVVAHLHEENIGAVTCFYHGVPAASFWSRHAALAINSHFLPSMIVAVTFDLAQPCCGSTIALRRSTLLGLGGFERFAGRLADDYEIGKALRNAGFEVAVPSITVGHHCFSESLASLLMQELRAARTVKCIAPIGYAGTFITHPFPLALVAALLDNGNAAGVAACALILRALLCVAVERSFALPRQPYALLPFRELLSFLVFCLSFLSASVNWRGIEFDVTPSGALRRKSCREAQGSAQS
jgi:ceramide glucosyltransferase